MGTVTNQRRAILWSGSALVMGFSSAAVLAQSAPPAAHGAAESFRRTAYSEESAEIIVNARKRDETSMAVPVAISAVGAAELERRGVTKLDDLSKMVPQLQIGDSAGGFQGGTITMRGLGSGDGNPLVDQSVSYVVDGAPVARATIRRMSEIDIQQIEVLKGPQALFFGKNSPGGIISIRSADPTASLAAKLASGYEVNAKEAQLQGYISGPLTDTLGARLALSGSTINGDVTNTIPKDHPLAPEHRSRPHDREFAGRLTLKWEPSESFNARFKLNHGVTRTAGLAENAQFVFCALGDINQYGNVFSDCKPNGKGFFPKIDPTFATRDYRFRDGEPYLSQKQTLGSLELNYLPTNRITVTSVTSLYDSELDYADMLALDVSGRGLVVATNLDIRDFSQELRLASRFESPLNFTVGALYTSSKGTAIIDAFVGLPSRVAGRQRAVVDSNAYSFFAQAEWDVLDTLELAGGARYSREKKSAKYFLGRDPGIFDIPRAINPPKRTFDNISPEATLTWRPSPKLTLFGAYRTGFLSGGYNTNVTGALDPSYNQQKTKGFEVGTKSILSGRDLQFNITAYRYVTTGLQVTIAFIRADGVPNSQIFNGGKMTSKGVEWDFNYITPLDGLSVRGALGYNHSRYNEFSALCYRGQTISAGCNQVFSPATGAFNSQDLKGQQVIRAPDWTINTGATFETAISAGMRISLSGDAAYTSSFFTETRNIPQSRQKSYWQVDAGLRLINESGWEIGLIGKNLTNEYYFIRTAEATSQGTTPGLATGTQSDLTGAVSRGRQIMLRASIKFGD
ncbi:TonB-dependent receptor [Rhizorhabdus argentea]|uniref:TonB-dependent receptor n=1 Tax=Rhizorhabdus argentea TaxID=1387174 RepID=UPI0030EF4890